MTELSFSELKKELKNNFENIELEVNEVEYGVSKRTRQSIWMETDKNNVKDIISFIKNIQTPHFVTMFGDDKDEYVELNYVLTIFYESEHEEITLVLGTEIEKENLEIESITDLIPGAITTEREMQEMLGIEIKDIPDDRHIYLPFDQPEENYPWRRDETGSEIIDVYEKEGQK